MYAEEDNIEQTKFNPLEGKSVAIDHIIDIPDDAFEPHVDWKELQKKSRQFLKDNFQHGDDYDCITNIQTGFPVCFYGKGIGKLTNVLGELKLKSLIKIEDIIKYGKLISIEEAQNSHEKVLSVYLFVSFIRFKGEVFQYVFFVKHKEEKAFLYEGVIKIEKPLKFL